MTEKFRVTRMYHPSFHAPDLGEVEAWFERVFGCQSTNIYETFKGRETGNYPTSYSTFTPMADVLMDTIRTELHAGTDRATVPIVPLAPPEPPRGA